MFPIFSCKLTQDIPRLPAAVDQLDQQPQQRLQNASHWRSSCWADATVASPHKLRLLCRTLKEKLRKISNGDQVGSKKIFFVTILLEWCYDATSCNTPMRTTIKLKIKSMQRQAQLLLHACMPPAMRHTAHHTCSMSPVDDQVSQHHLRSAWQHMHQACKAPP